MSSDASLRRAALLVLAVHGAVLAVIGLFPTPVDRAALPWIGKLLARMHQSGAPDWLTYSAVEFAANIALFVPLGVFAALAFGLRRAWFAVVLGLAASLAVELGQGVLLPARVPSGLDVVANALGAAVGAAFGFGVLAARAPSRHAPAEPATEDRGGPPGAGGARHGRPRPR